MTNNEQILRNALHIAREALQHCYDVVEWPNNGQTYQDEAIRSIDKALATVPAAAQPAKGYWAWIDERGVMHTDKQPADAQMLDALQRIVKRDYHADLDMGDFGVTNDLILDWIDGVAHQALAQTAPAAQEVPKNKPIYIVAENFQQAALYASERGLRHREWHYVNDVYQLKGLEQPEIIFTGTYDKRRDIVKILEETQIIQARGQKQTPNALTDGGDDVIGK